MRRFCWFLLILFALIPSTQQQEGCPNVGISQNTLDGKVLQVEWFNNEKYVYAVTKTSVYVSHDEGQTWTKKELGTGTITQLYITADETKQFVVENDNGVSTLWKTSDHGEKWDQVKMTEQIFDLYPHPTDGNWVVVHTYSSGCMNHSSSCIYKIHLSQDFGTSWRKLSEGVWRFNWGNAGKNGVSKEFAFQLRTDVRGSQRVFERTNDLFKSIDLSVNNTSDFGFYDGILYIAQSISYQVLQLLVSNNDGDTLKTAKFPTTFAQRSYRIFNIQQGLSYVAVEHSRDSMEWSNVYVTDFTSDAYVLSQEYVTKDQQNNVEFTGIHLNGVQMVNVYKLDQGQLPSLGSVVVSKITWNNGGQWNLINGPVDSCPPEASNCHIHFHGQSFKFSIESSASAVGLIVATANTGDILGGDLNTYISRDAGLTWEKIAEGTKIYEFSDYGGLLLLAEDEWATKSVLYSWDKGTTFTECTFGDQEHLISSIRTAPSGTSQNYLVVQSETDSSGIPFSIITHLDFSSLHQSQCIEEDYEWWGLSDGSTDFCVLGREIQFKRRKADAQCFNPENFETINRTAVCPCTREDYGCDYCYQEEENLAQISNTTCVNACDYDPAAAPADCNGNYQKTQGYRLVPGDQCQGGLNLNPQTADCPIDPNTTASSTGSTDGGDPNTTASSTDSTDGGDPTTSTTTDSSTGSTGTSDGGNSSDHTTTTTTGSSTSGSSDRRGRFAGTIVVTLLLILLIGEFEY